MVISNFKKRTRSAKNIELETGLICNPRSVLSVMVDSEPETGLISNPRRVLSVMVDSELETRLIK